MIINNNAEICVDEKGEQNYMQMNEYFHYNSAFGMSKHIEINPCSDFALNALKETMNSIALRICCAVKLCFFERIISKVL